MKLGSKQNITLLQINDTHAYLEPHAELFWEGNRAVYRTAGGYARILTLFNQVREECDGAVIALDNGDTLHGGDSDESEHHSGGKANRIPV